MTVEEAVQTLDLSVRYTPTPKQRLAHSAPERFILFGGGMRSGKSVWLVNEAIQLSLDYPGNVGFLARHEGTTLKKTTLVTMRQFLDPSLIKNWHRTDQFVELINGSVIYYGGLKPTQVDKPLERVKSLTLGWFAVDEATEIAEEFFLLLMSRLDLRLPDGTRPYYRGLLTANPEPGWVRERFVAQQLPNHRFISALVTENPYVPPDYITMLLQNFPQQWVDKYVKGNWDETATGLELIPHSWIMRAVNKKIKKSKGIRAIGVDVARGGANMSIIQRRIGMKVLMPLRLPMADTMETAGQTAIVADRFRARVIGIDSVGVGGGTFDRLDEQDYPVTEYVGGARAIDPDRFFNRRAELYWGIRECLERDVMSLPDDKNLISQLSSIRYKIRSDKTIQVESKLEMKRRGMKSPDEADALMVSFEDLSIARGIEYV